MPGQFDGLKIAQLSSARTALYSFACFISPPPAARRARFAVQSPTQLEPAPCNRVLTVRSVAAGFRMRPYERSTSETRLVRRDVVARRRKKRYDCLRSLCRVLSG